jgi:hypothetical protein
MAAKVQKPPRFVKLTAADALGIAQHYEELRAKRLAIEKQADAVKEVETAQKQLLLDMLVALNINSVGSHDKVYAIVTQDEPTVNDWPALYAHIKETGEFELLFRRVNSAAVKERWDNKAEVPGVGRFPAISLSVTKAKGA